ncbi:signal peptidase complex subunit 3 [Phyllostomus discolor]|uniref:Signal peptidase complex subunit 3 n=1 Tax=Phyllostomus discolor TaxID=89673 RepID=A0A833Z4S4_9CHIR|nr:signal peptidase complex subunit 3 [Phyllostomus discolor]
MIETWLKIELHLLWFGRSLSQWLLALNQVVLWDKIVLRGDNPKLLLKDMKTKYFFFDDGNGLKGNRNVTLTLSWNVVPNAGILPLVTGSGHVSVPFPDTYEIMKNY